MTTQAAPAHPLPHPPLREQLGYLRRITQDPQPVLDEMCARYGPVCGLGFGPTRAAIVGDPDALDEMFRMPVDSFRWGHKFNVLGFIVGDGSMIVSDGDDHKRRRASVQAAFSRRRLNRWIPMIVERVDAAIDLSVDAGKNDAIVDLYTAGREVVFEIAVRAFFGERLAARIPELDPLFQRSQDYLESSALRQIPHPFPRTARARVKADRRAIDSIIDGEIAHYRAHPDEDSFDILQALVGNGELSDAEIRDQVVTLIGAGYHTTAASLAWTVVRAVSTPGLWADLRAEADEVFGSPAHEARTTDDASLGGLVLADRVMRETLRLHPAGVVSPREAAVDMTVGGHRIRKGTLILWSPHLAGRDPQAWPDPLQFDPDRFLTTSSHQRALADAAWMPFGRTPRNCIGFALAQMELTLIIARLAQRLDLTPTATDVPRPYGMVVNRPEGGVPMRVRARAL